MDSLVVQIIICIVGGYVFGNFQTGFLIGKLKHVDIRQHGSGNSGTTNALRTLGLKAGLLTYLGDFIKTLIPLLLVKLVLFDDLPQTEFLELITGFGVVIGHNYPFWLHFKGGKGIASTSAIMVAFDPWLVLVAAVSFFVPTGITKYVSLGSLCMSASFVIYVAITRWGEPYSACTITMTVVLFVLALWRHRANIGRLKAGTENKISLKKK